MRLIKCYKFIELNTALPNIWAEQSACTFTSPDENAVTRSVKLGSKISEKEVALIFNFKGTLLSDNF